MTLVDTKEGKNRRSRSTNELDQIAIRYNTCRCRFGKPALRCPDEKREYCNPDQCDKYYHYDSGWLLALI